jgi:glyoxylase-like metal-dependent hydrolase (beta-lactamase superfamily II)
MTVDQILPGLWRWTCPHPEWTPEEGGPDGWEPDVGCVYYEAPEAVVLIDPLLPSDPSDEERLLRALDRDVERLGLPVAILLTTYYHERSAAEFRDRYAHGPGADIWAPASFIARLAAVDARAISSDARLPAGIGVVPTSRPGQVVYWLPSPRAAVPGDLLLGDGRGGLRVCPDAWLQGPAAPREVRLALRALLDLPVEMVLVSHGAPVLTAASSALTAALA